MGGVIGYVNHGEFTRHILGLLTSDATLRPYEIISASTETQYVGGVIGMSAGYAPEMSVAVGNYTHKGTIDPKLRGTNQIISSGVLVANHSETAEFIANQGNSVYLVEMLSEIGTGGGLINKMDLMQHLFVANVESLTNHKLNSIGEKSIKLQNLKENKEIELEVDKVVMALGVRSDNKLYAEIKDNFNKVYLIGDAAAPRTIAHAVKEGFEKAYILN